MVIVNDTDYFSKHSLFTSQYLTDRRPQAKMMFGRFVDYHTQTIRSGNFLSFMFRGQMILPIHQKVVIIACHYLE
jgi:hypothetical protein